MFLFLFHPCLYIYEILYVFVCVCVCVCICVCVCVCVCVYQGKTTEYAMNDLEARGTMFVAARTEVYNGMCVCVKE